MYREFFANHPMLALPVISLLLFIAVFAMIVVRTMRRRPSQFDALAALPLDGAAELTHGR
jgi:hypothetical protein